MLNRRSLFAFIAVAPVAVPAAIAAKPVTVNPEPIRIRIKAIVAGQPAWVEGKLADVRFLTDDNEGATLVIKTPDDIHRVEIYDDNGSNVRIDA